jgi:colicin import membrane protein
LPREAAPKEVVPPPPPPPPPPPRPVVQTPPPPPVAKPPPAPPVQRDPQIAIDREKHKRELEKLRKAEAELEREELRKELALKKRNDELALKKREEELAKKKELQKQQLADAKRKEDEKKRKQQEQEAREARDAKRREEIRTAQIQRSLAMAGTGAPGSSGSAAQSSGPSAGWGARVRARVKPNIVFTDVAGGNPQAVVVVRLSPDGTIVGKRLKTSSGNHNWDEAVLRALDKTEVLPRDPENGRVPSEAELVFRPKD